MSEIQVDAPVEDSGSLSDHEAQYGHGGAVAEPPAKSEPVETDESDESDESETPEAKAERDRNEKGQFSKGKHRAASQKAGPEDVPRIQELTRRRKEAESRAEVLEARIRELEAPRSRPEPTYREPEPVKTAEYAEKEPTLEQFRDTEDPYAAWIRAVARYDLKKEQWEERQKADAERSESENRQLAAKAEELRTSYNDRLEAAKEKYEGFDALLVKHQSTIFTPVMQALAILNEDGPETVYHLLTHPGDLAGLRLLTSSQPATQENVADAMTWLSERRGQVEKTGTTATATRKYSPPPPPIPVRTVPSSPPDSSSDEGSLADHEKKWHGQKRR